MDFPPPAGGGEGEDRTVPFPAPRGVPKGPLGPPTLLKVDKLKVDFSHPTGHYIPMKNSALPPPLFEQILGAGSCQSKRKKRLKACWK